MVSELKDIITKVEQLKDDEQRAIAKLLEEEIQWDKTLQSSQQQLSTLANEAIEEYRKGKTQRKDW
jgi:K+/H+ antiporter YhaU regulatory subunit KhtT